MVSGLHIVTQLGGSDCVGMSELCWPEVRNCLVDTVSVCDDCMCCMKGSI